MFDTTSGITAKTDEDEDCVILYRLFSGLPLWHEEIAQIYSGLSEEWFY